MISKAQLRKEYIGRRLALKALEVNAALQIRENVLKMLDGWTSSVIAGYAAIRGELDLAPTLQGLNDNDMPLCLPVTNPEPSALSFRRWAPDVSMTAGSFGTVEPNAKAEEVVPDVLLVPLVAFDKEGHRIGYGQGYYDRTLHELRQGRNIVAYGIGYDGQETEAVPHDEDDAPLDGIITPTRTLMVKSDRSGSP